MMKYLGCVIVLVNGVNKVLPVLVVCCILLVRVEEVRTDSSDVIHLCQGPRHSVLVLVAQHICRHLRLKYIDRRPPTQYDDHHRYPVQGPA